MARRGRFEEAKTGKSKIGTRKSKMRLAVPGVRLERSGATPLLARLPGGRRVRNLKFLGEFVFFSLQLTSEPLKWAASRKTAMHKHG